MDKFFREIIRHKDSDKFHRIILFKRRLGICPVYYRHAPGGLMYGAFRPTRTRLKSHAGNQTNHFCIKRTVSSKHLVSSRTISRTHRTMTKRTRIEIDTGNDTSCTYSETLIYY